MPKPQIEAFPTREALYDAAASTIVQALTTAVEPGDPEAVCTTVMARIGLEQPTDDIAVLTVCRDLPC